MFMGMAGLKAGEAGGAPGLGETPAFGSVGATTSSVTLAATHNIAYPAGVQLGDLLLCAAVGRNASPSDATLAMSAGMSGDGWQHLTGSPFLPASARTLLIAWKIALAADVTASASAGNIVGGIVGSGTGVSNDAFLAHCGRWTAADGFAANPFESITSVTRSIVTSHTPGPAITPTDGNRRGVGIFGGQATSVTMSEYVGATGGTWVAGAHISGTQSCLNTQSVDLSAGTPITGGTATLSTAAGGPSVGFALVPSGSEPPPPPVLFRVGTVYPEYSNTGVGGTSHTEVPWAKLDELYYFGFSPRVDYSTNLNVTTDVFTETGHPFTNGQTVQLRDVDGSTTPSRLVTNQAASGGLAFNAAADTITRTSGSWIAEGYVVGGKITISNAEDSVNPNNNNQTHTLSGVTATVLTVAASPGVAATNAADTTANVAINLLYDTNYFVRDVVAGTSFKLELSSGSGAINFQGSGQTNGRRFKAATAFLNRYEFNPAADAAATADLFAQRDAQNPNCKIWLTIGRDHNIQELYAVAGWNGGTGMSELMASTLAIYNEQDFVGVLTDIEPLDVSGGLPVGEPFTADGPIIQAFHAALRAALPPGALIGHYTGVTGPSETKEYLAARMITDGDLDFVFLSGYAMVFPGVSNSQVWHHGALNHTVSDYGTPTGGAQHGIVKLVGQFATDAEIPPSKLILGIQAGGVPWIGGIMNGPAGSVGHGARFPLNTWASGNAPDAATEVTYRNRGDLALTGELVDALAVGYFGYKTNANPALELFWAAENPETCATKRAWAEGAGLAGIFMWQLGGDDTSFSLHEALGPPAGS